MKVIVTDLRIFFSCNTVLFTMCSILVNYEKIALVRLGQVRLECLMCTTRANCCSACLSWAQAPSFPSSLSGTGKKVGGGGGGPACTGWYKGVQAVQLESVAGGG